MIPLLLLIVALVWFFKHQKEAPISPASPKPLFTAKVEETKSKPTLTPAPQAAPSIQVATPQPVLPPAPVTQDPHHKTRPESVKTQIDFEIREGYAVAFGDTLLGKPPTPLPEGTKGSHEPEATRLWPQSTISYFIRPEIKNPAIVRQALDHLEKNTPLQFKPIESANEDALVFEPGQELCASYMGRIGGPQPILVAERCTWNEIVHEILHALGFPHEQSRPDRDKYVEILSDNIEPRFLPQFERLASSPLDVLESTGFDYHSIMLYSRSAFVKSPELESIKTRDPQYEIAPSREGLSPIDKDRLFRMFNAR